MIALFFGLASAFALTGCVLHSILPADYSLFNHINSIFIATLIPCFLWYLYAVQVVWPKKLFVFSYAATSAFVITAVCNVIITKLYWNRTDGLPYQGSTLLILSLLTAVFLPVLSLFLKRYYPIAKDSFTYRESVYLSCLSLTLLLILTVDLSLFGYSSLYHSTMALLLFAVLLAAIFLINGICFQIVEMAQRKLEAQQKFDEMQSLYALQSEQHHRITETVELTQRMRHDLRHHMLALQGFLKSEDTEKARQYLDYYLESYRTCGISQLCGNHIVNVIVSHYQSLAAERDVRFSVHISIPDNSFMEDMDLSIVLGNLLENAVYAAGQETVKDRFICLKMACVRQLLTIAVDNSFDGDVQMAGSQFISSKRNHSGFGLKSIAAIAEKYSGSASFTFDSGVFHSSIILSLQADARRQPLTPPP